MERGLGWRISTKTRVKSLLDEGGGRSTMVCFNSVKFAPLSMLGQVREALMFRSKVSVVCKECVGFKRREECGFGVQEIHMVVTDTPGRASAIGLSQGKNTRQSYLASSIAFILNFPERINYQI